MKTAMRIFVCLAVTISLFSNYSYAANEPVDATLRTISPAYTNYFLEDSTRPASGSLFSAFSHSFLLYRGGASVVDQDIMNYGASTYDNVLLGMIRLANGSTDLLDAYVKAYKNPTSADNQFLYYHQRPTGDTTSGYQDGNGDLLLYGPYRILRITGREVPNWYDTWDFGVDTGAASMLTIYALEGYRRFPATVDYKNLAVFMGEYLLRLQDTDGGIRYGPRKMYHAGLDADGNPEINPVQSEFYWKLKSTEQNERALYAFEALYAVTQDARYSQAVDKLKTWLKGMYNKTAHLFYSAAQFKGGIWVKSPLGLAPETYAYIATDVMALAPLKLMFEDSYFGGTQAERNTEVNAMLQAIETATGSKFKDGSNRPLLFRFSVNEGTGNDYYGSVEISSHMALAYKNAAQYFEQNGDTASRDKYNERYTTLIASLEGFFKQQSDANHLTAPYASIFSSKETAGNVPTGTGFNTYNCDAALASLYFVFAKAGYNPSMISGGNADIAAPSTTDNIANENWRTADVQVILTATDATGVSETKYSINDAAFQTYTAPITLSNDGVYVIKYYSVDALNNTEPVKVSKRVRIDKTAPIGTFVIENNNEYTTTLSVNLTFSVSDLASGINQGRIELTLDLPSAPSRQWQPFSYASTIRFDLPSANTPRVIYARFIDEAGNTSLEVSDSIKVDNTVPVAPVITDAGAFTNSTTELNISIASQDNQSGIAKIYYSVLADSPASGVSLKDEVIITQGGSGSVTNYLISGLSMQLGKTYYLKSWVENGAGLLSSYGYSDGITIGSGDANAPVTTDNITDEVWRKTAFDVVLSATDSSGISETKYSINDAAFQTYTAPINFSNDGVYVIKYYSVDTLNNTEVVKTSKRLRIDKTAPTGTVLLENGREYISQSEFAVSFSANDATSGMTNGGIDLTYDAPLVTNRQWQHYAYSTGFRASQPSAQGLLTIYARFTDEAGNSSAEVSDSIFIDTTVPAAPSITDDGAFTNSAAELRVSISSQDSESGIAKIYYSVLADSPASATSLKDGIIDGGFVTNYLISGLTLQSGKTYYIKARAENAAGLSSAYGYSDGITVNAATSLQISRLDRQTASADEIIAISGRGFGTNKANLRVDFDSLPGYILGLVDAGGTQVITCRVPYALRSSFNVRVTILSTSEISNAVLLKLRFGDIDGNQKIDLRDIFLCVNQMMGRAAQTLAADVDRSGGAIDMTDLFVIVAQAINDDPFNPQGSYPVELLQAAPIQQIPIGKTLSFKLTAPTKGIAPIYSLKNPPSGMLINRFTGQVTWKPVSNQAGKTYTPTVRVAYSKGQFTVYDEETVIVKVLSSAAALSVKDLTTNPITIKSGAMFFQTQVTPGALDIQSVRLIFERDTSRGRSSGNYAMNYNASIGTYETYLYKSSPATLKNVSYKIIVTDKSGTRRETAMVNLGDI